MTATADLRRQYRAARTLATAPQRIAALQTRTTQAESLLGAVLCQSSTPRIIVPGFALWRDPTGALHVQPVEPIDAAQLALWTSLAREERA